MIIEKFIIHFRVVLPRGIVLQKSIENKLLSNIKNGKINLIVNFILYLKPDSFDVNKRILKNIFFNIIDKI